ncbi:InlB B-repeat-containing protein [Listeria seeligeri]|uniref:InlB B-repeat-containing protein n=1 Tax=Listeria seeligeri TaxID=1640 RepID=UPI001887B769|nr:InlB B-repeat-containing protein [Listeria seeligeri]MBF2345230.1 InlB B-repeat-containing protein [Listeria seeligeri]
MKRNYSIIYFLAMLSIIVGISIWIGTSNEMVVQADNINQPAPINQIFPDPDLANEVKDETGKTDVSEVVSQAELNSVTILHFPGVSTFEGIQFLNNLKTIETYQGSASDFSLLSSLTNLEFLMLQKYNISDLSFASGLVNLKDLSVTQNKISDLTPISGLTNLISFDVSWQEVTAAPVFYQENLVVPNQVKNVDGTLIAPTSISNSGSYSNPNLTWNLPTFLNSVNYSFDQQVTIGNATNRFNGTVNQPLKLGYNAIFDVDGTQTSEMVEENTLIPEPQDPTKEGYTFTGWYDAKTGGNKWDFNTETMPTNDMTLYAQFTKNSYTATFDVDGTTTSQSVAYQEFLTEPTEPTKAGYSFTGWYDAKTDGNKWDFSTETMPANDMTLYAQFSPNKYLVTFDVDGKTTSESVAYQGNVPQPADPWKTGYTFTGWYDAKTGGNKWDFSTGIMPANDMTLYAQFSINNYTVTFNVDGKTTNQSIVYQGNVMQPADPSKEGYTFTGWYDTKTGGNKWDFSTGVMPANDMTLYAQFTKNKSTNDGNKTPGQGTNSNNGSNNGNNSPNNSINSSNNNKSMQVNEKVDNLAKTLPTTGDKSSLFMLLIGVLCIVFSARVFRQTNNGSK